jgi:hypothetical protein
VVSSFVKALQMTTLKSRAVMRQQLLGDPLSVAPQDLDSETVDTTPEHRQAMRIKLYGQNRAKQSKRSFFIFRICSVTE